MKRYIIAGRDPDKHYNSIKFSGWTKTKDSILEQAQKYLTSGSDRQLHELKRYIRYAISEAEAAAASLSEYRRILEQANHADSRGPIESLVEELSGYRFKQSHGVQEPRKSRTIDPKIKQFIDDLVVNIVEDVNDDPRYQNYYGEEFRQECFNRLLDAVYDEFENANQVEWYIRKVLSGYGEM